MICRHNAVTAVIARLAFAEFKPVVLQHNVNTRKSMSLQLGAVLHALNAPLSF